MTGEPRDQVLARNNDTTGVAIELTWGADRVACFLHIWGLLHGDS